MSAGKGSRLSTHVGSDLEGGSSETNSWHVVYTLQRCLQISELSFNEQIQSKQSFLCLTFSLPLMLRHVFNARLRLGMLRAHMSMFNERASKESNGRKCRV